jgi:hypothetical protein
MLASIYPLARRENMAKRLREPGQPCYLPYAFGYQAPLLERIEMLHPSWQYRLEEGARVLLPTLKKKDRGHLIKRMQGDGSTSAEKKLLLVRGFALFVGRASPLAFRSGGFARPPGPSSVRRISGRGRPRYEKRIGLATVFQPRPLSVLRQEICVNRRNLRPTSSCQSGLVRVLSISSISLIRLIVSREWPRVVRARQWKGGGGPGRISGRNEKQCLRPPLTAVQ